MHKINLFSYFDSSQHMLFSHFMKWYFNLGVDTFFLICHLKKDKDKEEIEKIISNYKVIIKFVQKYSSYKKREQVNNFIKKQNNCDWLV